MRLIYVCRTCDRNTEPAPGQRRAGEALAANLREFLDADDEADWDVREVACLNGCLKPCNLSFRGADRFTYRFSRVTVADMPDIAAFGRAYWEVAGGEVAAERIPPGLRAKLTVYTPPRGRW